MSYIFDNFKQPMMITVLPSLGIFNREKLFATHYEWIENIFEETFEVDLIPGIYVYNFR